MKQFEGYEEYLKQSELSKQTRQVYLREAEKFVRYLNGKEITKARCWVCSGSALLCIVGKCLSMCEDRI